MNNLKTFFPVLAAAIVIFMVSHLPLSAQNWPAEGVTWRYCFSNWAGSPAAYIEFGVTHDTVIDGKNWHMIQQTADQFGPVTVPPDHPMTLLTRYSNDTIYRWVNSQEYLYFTFNLEVGDVFTTFRSAGNGNNWSDSACSSKLPLKVIDFEMVQYGDLNLKQYTLRDTLFHYLYETNYPDEVIYVLTERIGVLNSLPLINTMEPSGYTGGLCELATDWGEYHLGTYSDNETEILFDLCQGVGIETSTEPTGIEIFPNPSSSDYLRLRVGFPYDNQHMELHCYDNFGRLIHSRKIYNGQQDTVLDVSTWPPGIYIAVVYSDGSARGKAKFVVR